MIKKIVRQYYIFYGLFYIAGAQLMSAIYVDYLITNGLNLLQANLVNLFFYMALFIGEIPTGAFADVFGRKHSFVMACGLRSLGLFIYGWSEGFWGFVMAEIVIAIGSTFATGAFKAWLVDSLKHYGYEGEYDVFFAKASLIRLIGGGFGAIAGSYLSAYNSTLPWLVGGAAMLFTTLAADKVMREDYFQKKKLSWKDGWKSMKHTAKTSIHYGRNSYVVRFILVSTFLQCLAVMPLNMYWQPFFKGNGIGEAHLGILFAGMTGFVALGAYLVTKTKSSGKERMLIVTTQGVVGMCLIVTTQMTSLPIVVAIFLLHEIPRGMWEPLLSNYLHKRIPSETRATVDSFCSMAPHIGGAIGLVTSGFIAQFYGIHVAWIISGSILIVGGLLMSYSLFFDP